MSNYSKIIQLLNDKQYHTGTAIGESLNIGRSAVWKSIEQLRQYGVEIESAGRKGYRLIHDIELLNEESIRSCFSTSNQSLFDKIEICESIESTNTYLMQAARNHTKGNTACLAELQTGGKGRNGRSWISSFASNIALSLLWRFETLPGGLSGLSLVVGIALCKACEQIGITNTKLKWPNDIYWNERKLGGILIEIQGEPWGPCNVVIGVGINVNLAKEFATEIDQPWVDCNEILTTKQVSRNHLAATVMENIALLLQQFQEQGFEPFTQEWPQYDILFNQAVNVHLPDKTEAGTAIGINSDGALLVEIDGKQRPFYSGDATLRKR